MKACILARVAAAPEILFEDRRYSEKCWTHNLSELVNLAGLKATLAGDLASDPNLDAYWEIVQEWSEASRYQRRTKGEAEDLYEAIAEKKHGVMSWIKGHW